MPPWPNAIQKQTGARYEAHRERQRRRILEAAERLFDERGMDRATIAEITALVDVMAEDLAGRRARVRFMAQFDAMYARECPAERLISIEARISKRGFAQFPRKSIRDGVPDGSLRSDLDPDVTMHAVMNAMIGAQRRLAMLGDRVEKEYGKPVDALFREASGMILLGLRAEKKDGKRRK